MLFKYSTCSKRANLFIVSYLNLLTLPTWIVSSMPAIQRSKLLQQINFKQTLNYLHKSVFKDEYLDFYSVIGY